MDISSRRHGALALAAIAVVSILLLVFAVPAFGQRPADAPAVEVADTHPLSTDAPLVNLTPDDPGVMLTSPAATPDQTSSSASQGTTGTPATGQAALAAVNADDPAPAPDPTTNPEPTPADPYNGAQPNGPNGELGPTTPPPLPNPADATNPTINPTP